MLDLVWQVSFMAIFSVFSYKILMWNANIIIRCNIIPRAYDETEHLDDELRIFRDEQKAELHLFRNFPTLQSVYGTEQPVRTLEL